MTAQEVPKKPLQGNTPSDNAFGWDIPERTTPNNRRFLWIAGNPEGWILSDRFDRLFPPHRRYLRHSRRTFLTGVFVIFLLLMGLIIGLAVGLTRKSKHRNLPLPNGAQSYTGDLTYYSPGLGACGVTSGDKDAIVSVSHYTFDAVQKGSNPNSNPLCGKKIRAQRTFNGKAASADLTVVDRCTGCEPTDLDVSPGVFSNLANPDQGRVVVTWIWL